MSRVAVIGAGMAGASCAQTLAENGLDVTLFDKARGPGGRMATRNLEPDLAFDHGAQYFTVRSERFARQVEISKEQGCVVEWGGRVVSLAGGVIAETSAQQRFVGVPGMSAVAASLSADLEIHNNSRIERIVRAEGAWELNDHTGTQFGLFDFLVLSLPAPQSAALLASHPFANVVAGVVMTPCWATLLAFKDRLDVPWDGAFVSESPLSWVARNSSKPGRPSGADCWVLHASPEWSATFLEESPEVVGEKMRDAFEEAVQRSLPNAQYQAAHRWRYSLGADPAERATLFDPEAGLAVCGDWLSGGRIEGAYLSGTKAADAILQTLGLSQPHEDLR